MIVSSTFILLGTLAVVIPLFACFIWCFLKQRNTRRKAKFRKPGRKERAQYQKVNAKCSGEEEEAVEYISVSVKSEKVTQKGKQVDIIHEVLNRVAKRGNHQEYEFTQLQEDNKMRGNSKKNKKGKNGDSSEKKKNGKEKDSVKKDDKGKKSGGKSNKYSMFHCKSPQTGSGGEDIEEPEEKGASFAVASRMSTRQTNAEMGGKWTAIIVSKDPGSEEATKASVKRNLFSENSSKSRDSTIGENDSRKKQSASHGAREFDNKCYDPVQQKKSRGRSDSNGNDNFGEENPDARRDVKKRPEQQHYVPPPARKGNADTAGKRGNPCSSREGRNAEKPVEKEVLDEDEKHTEVRNIDSSRHDFIIDGSSKRGSLPNDELEETVYENMREKEQTKFSGTYENVSAPNQTKPAQYEVVHVRDESTYENTRNLRYSSKNRSGSQQGERADSLPQAGKLQSLDDKHMVAENVNKNPVYETVLPVKSDINRQDSNSDRTARSSTSLQIKIQSKVNSKHKDKDEQKVKDTASNKFKRSISQKAPSKKEEMKTRQTEALRRSHSDEFLPENERRSDILIPGGTKLRVQNGIIFCGDYKSDALVSRTDGIVKQDSEKEKVRKLASEKDRVVKAKRPESITAPLLIDDYAASEWKGETVKADKIRRGYERVKRETGLICIRRIRGDNYCALRAVLFKALSSGIDIMMRFRNDGGILKLPHVLLAEKHNWIREWSFAKRLPLLNNSVEDTLTDCLSVLEETVARSTSCYDDNERYGIILDKMNGSEQDEVKLFEAVKFLMLYNSIKLHKGMLSGQETSILPILLFARDTSTEPKSFMKNHLNHVGDSGGLDQLEMILLGHTLKIVIIVMRLHQVDEQDFIAQFPDDLEDPEDKIYLVAEDDRHYNALSEEA